MNETRMRPGYKPLTAILRHTDQSTCYAILVPYRKSLRMAVNCACGILATNSDLSGQHNSNPSPLAVASSGEGLPFPTSTDTARISINIYSSASEALEIPEVQ